MSLLLLAALVATSAPVDRVHVHVALPAEQSRVVDQATVPLIVMGNRPFVDLTFRKPDGSTRTARFLLDTGGGGFLMTESLARDLGIKWGAPMREEGTEFAVPTTQPNVFVKDFPLELTPQRVLVLVGKTNMLPPVAPGSAEGMIPGHVLARYHVVFDYPAGLLTIAQRAGTFAKYMSGMMTAPISGSLAGNVLKHFRVQLDYPHQALYLTSDTGK